MQMSGRTWIYASCGAAALAAGAAFAQDPSTSLPAILADPDVARANYLPDFSYAGYGYGLEPVPTVSRAIDVADYGAVPDDGKDDSIALKAALAAAHDIDGPVRVQLAPGRYQLTEILWIEKSGIVLSGSGMGEGGTELYMPRPLKQVDGGGAFKEIREYLVKYDKRERQPEQNLDVLFSEYSWTGGFIWARVPGGRHATYLEEYDRPIREVADIAGGAQGARRIEVPNAEALSVGDVLQIHWHNRAGPDGPLVQSLYGQGATGGDLPIGDRHWMLPDRPLVRQATRIEAIDGTRVTIADPLLHDIDADLPAYFAEWDHLSDVGIQDLALTFPENPYFGHHNEAGYNGIYFTGVHNGWIRNVAISEADSGILTDDLANVTIANVVTRGSHFAHYAIHMGNVHNVLVTGHQAYNPTQHTFSFNTQATKAVYHNSAAWTQPTLDQHAGANHQNLYDNITLRIRPDKTAPDGGPMYDLYRAGGAGYWLPGHGRYNTMWNVNVLVTGGAAPGEAVTIFGGSEGPDARVIGMHGNRPLILSYDPSPYVEALNRSLIAAPSLYDYQLAKRRR